MLFWCNRLRQAKCLCSCLAWLVTQILLVKHNWVMRINISICVSCFIYSTVAVKSCGSLEGTWFIHADTSSGIAGWRLAGSPGPGWAEPCEESGQCGLRAQLIPAHTGQQNPWLAAQPDTIHCFSVLPQTRVRAPGTTQGERTLRLWLSHKNSDHCFNIIKELINFPLSNYGSFSPMKKKQQHIPQVPVGLAGSAKAGSLN